MKIVSVLNEKGGTGKSTVATNLATILHRQGKRVVLIDCDLQGTARDWREYSPEGANVPPVLGADRPQALADGLAGLGAEIVILDGPGRAGRMTAAMVKASHVALLVIQPSGADLWASEAAVKLVQAKHDIGGEVHAAFLLNRASASTSFSKTVKAGEWNNYEGVSKLDAFISDRAVFSKAMTAGLSVFDFDDEKAKDEFMSVVHELRRLQWI